MARLDGRVAVVTGAAGGLGGGVARALAREGALIICVDIRDASATAAELPGAHALALDVTDSAAVDRAVASIVSEYGPLDILVASHGIAQPPAPVTETPDDVLDRVLDVNVKGVVYCARATARHMVEQRRGRIIIIASQAGKVGWANWSVYCASKAAVVVFTQALALEVAGHGVTANCICPGAMLTDMTRASFRLEAARAEDRDPEEMLTERARALPVGRLGTPEDVGAMAAWLASDEASFTTGASFNLTGGESVFF